MPEIRALARPHAARTGAPSIDRVDLAIFARRYFARCLDCSFCGDWCCTHGVEIDEPTVARIVARRKALERFTGIPSEAWFDGEVRRDPEHPGGAYRRTRVIDGACAFLGRSARGCLLHAFALAEGLDYHELKPLVSTLFPLTFDGGLLHPSDEVHAGTLVCLNEGPTLYRAARDELAHHFGPELLAELDAIEAALPPTPPPPRRLRLPIAR